MGNELLYYNIIILQMPACLYITRRKTFTHEKREQVGMDLVRSTEANRNHTSMHACNNKPHPCNSLYLQSPGLKWHGSAKYYSQMLLGIGAASENITTTVVW